MLKTIDRDGEALALHDGAGSWYMQQNTLGCQCCIISNIREPQAKHVESNTLMLPNSAATKAVRDLVEANGGREGIYKHLKEYLEPNYGLVIMSGLANNDQGKPSKTYHIHGPWSVAAFVDYLKSVGEYIIATPLLANPQHLDTGSFSLRRGWFWMPNTEAYNARHIKDTGYVANVPTGGRFIDFADWRKKYFELPKFEIAELRG